MKRALVFCAALLALLTAAPATTLVVLSVERMAEVSPLIIRGRAVESWSQWDETRTRITTYTRFVVEQRLKGAAPATVLVKQIGGRVPGYEQRVAGVRYWRRQDEAVLFLRPSRSGDGTLLVTGLVQGDFRVLRAPGEEPTVSNGVPEVRAYDPGSRTARAYAGTRMTLRELERRVLRVRPR